MLSALERPKRLLATILIGNTTVNIFAAVVAALFTEQLTLRYGFPKLWAYLINVVVVTFAILIAGEITPKVFAARHAERFALFAYRILIVIEIIFYPVSEAILQLSKVLERIIARLKGTPLFSGDLSDEDIKTIAEVGLERGNLESTEKELIDSVLDFREKTVREVMTPRTDINALTADATLQEAMDLVLKEGNSRIPLYLGDLDSITGIIYAKDLVKFLNGRKKAGKFDWKKIAREPLFVFETTKLDDLLREFQQKRMHIAIVVDEHGGTSGLVTLEDVIEEIIGETAPPEGEPDEAMHKALADGTHWFDAKINIDAASEVLGKTLAETGSDYDTLGGFLFHLIGDIPEENERIRYENLEFEIEKLDGNRIASVTVRVVRTAATSEPPAA